MSTPNSSSGEEEKSERTEYNTLLQGKGRSTTEKAFGSNSSSTAPFIESKDSLKPSTESLDFDEVESLIWRKVRTQKLPTTVIFPLKILSKSICSIIYGDFFKIVGYGGQQVDKPLLGGGS